MAQQGVSQHLQTHRVWGIVGPRRSYKTTLAMQLWSFYYRQITKEKDMSTLLVFTSDAAHRKDWEDAGMPPVFLYDLKDLEAKATELREAMLRSRLMRVVVVLDQVYFHLDCRPLILSLYSDVLDALIFTIAPEDFVEDYEDYKKDWPRYIPHAVRTLDTKWLFSPQLSEQALKRLQTCFPRLKDPSTRKALSALEPCGFRPYPRWSEWVLQTTPGSKEIPVSYGMTSLWEVVRPPPKWMEEEREEERRQQEREHERAMASITDADLEKITGKNMGNQK